MTEKTFRSIRWGVVGLLLLMVWPVYRGMILYTMVMFKEPLEDMSHGWVIPFVSLFVLWRQRNAFREAAGSPSARGFLWVCLFMTIAWFGGRGMQSRMEQISLIGLIWAIPYAFWGKRVARLMLFPAAFLIFTIPVSSFVDFFTIHLRVIATSLATFLANGLGMPVEQVGKTLFSRVPGAEFSVDVADGCSGIHSFFAMMALTAAYAYFSSGTFIQKWILFFCSVPIAVIGNSFRLFSICVIASWFGQKTVFEYYHVFSDFPIFVAGVFLMIKIHGFLEKKRIRFQKLVDYFYVRVNGSQYKNLMSGAKGVAKPLAVVFGTLVLALFIFASHIVLPPPALESADFIATSLPQNMGEYVGTTPLFCQNERCLGTFEREQLGTASDGQDGSYRCPACGEKLHTVSLGEWNKLPKDTVIVKRIYRSPSGVSYSVSVVVSGKTRGGIHRAELCLPAQGFTMVKAERKTLHVTAKSSIRARLITAEKTSSSAMSLVYWFVSKDRQSCSHVTRIWTDIWDRSIHNRINRWAMVAVNVSSALDTPESIERFESFLADLYPKVVKKN